MQALDLQIAIYGWALVQVGEGSGCYCYTVGLVENYGHPELTILDVDVPFQRSYIDDLVGGLIAEGEVPIGLIRQLGVELVEVHADHLRGELFATWANRYGRFPASGEVLQVVPPAGAFCARHAHLIRRLDRPGSTSPPRGPNRAERRRQARRRGG
jgi:hypothetical protein